MQLTSKNFIKPSLIFWFVIGMIPLNVLVLLSGSTVGMVYFTICSLFAIIIRIAYNDHLVSNMDASSIVFFTKSNERLRTYQIGMPDTKIDLHKDWMPFVKKEFRLGWVDDYAQIHIGARYYFIQGFLTCITILPFYLIAIYFYSVWARIRKFNAPKSKIHQKLEQFNNFLDKLN